MDPSLIPAIVGMCAVALTACGFVWGRYTWIKKSNRTRLIAEVESLCDLYEKSDMEVLLKCHGIDPGEIDRAGITLPELQYLIIEFTIQRLYEHSDRKKAGERFRKNSYRYNLCDTTLARDAFPFLERVLGDHEIAPRIKETFKYIDGDRSETTGQNSDGQR